MRKLRDCSLRICKRCVAVMFSIVVGLMLGMDHIPPLAAQLPLNGIFDQPKAAPSGGSSTQMRGQPLGDLLNADGTLDLESGYRGSIDPSGFELVSGAGDAPRFVQVPGDEKWQPGFGTPGMDNIVFALTLDGAGNLYAGGVFTKAGGVSTNRISKWNGTGWSALRSCLINS